MYYKKFKNYFFFYGIFCCLHVYSQGIKEIQISIPAKPDSLYGTLLLSHSKQLCIIHAGSGPTDRDGNSDFGGENYCLKKLADSLSQHHISVFRYDKRGVGKSKDALESEDSLTINNYVNDLVQWIDFFSKSPYKFKEIILLGHSEGGLIATLAIQKRQKVKKLILLAGAGFRADTILKRQLSYIHEDAKKIIFPLFDSLAAGKRIENVPPILSMFFRESIQNYMMSWLAIDPAKELSKIKIPVLIIQGENDLQVSIKDAERLAEFKKEAVLKIVPEMNHILVEAPKERKANLETYNKSDLPLSKELVPSIILFLKK